MIRMKMEIVENDITVFILVNFPMFILKYWSSFKLIGQTVEYLHGIQT